MKPFFVNEGIALDLSTTPSIKTKQRVSVSESLLDALRGHLSDEHISHLNIGDVGIFTTKEYGQKSSDTWVEKHVCASVQFPAWATKIERQPQVTATAITSYSGSVYVTPEFLSHLKNVDADDHEWEFVP